MTMKSLLLSRVWGLYSEIVHQTVFFEVVTHGPLGFLSKVLATVATMTEEKQMITAFSVALLLSLAKSSRGGHNGEAAGREKHEDPSKAERKGKAPQPRDKYGRFTKRRKKGKR